jgi:hypothetical protein
MSTANGGGVGVTMRITSAAITIMVGAITIMGLGGATQAARPAPAAPPASAINWRFGMMLSAWQKVTKPKALGWALRVTPPLPLHWGENRPIEWVLYGYGADVLPDAADAERIARPFAIGRIGRPAAPGDQPETKVEVLRTTLEPLELQGVRPRYASEQVIWQPVERACLSMTAPPASDSAEASQLRHAYQAWLKDNGVIAQELSRDHDAFFTWVRAK